MKKGFDVLLGIALIVAVLCLISPNCKKVFQKHIPAVGHEVVSMTEDLADVGMEEVSFSAGGREVAERVIDDVVCIANSGIDYFATADDACIKRGAGAADDLVDIGMSGITNAFETLFVY